MTTDNVTVSRELLEQAWRELASAGVGLECRAALRAALDAPAVEPEAWYDGRKFYATPSAAHMDCADIKALRPLYEAPQAQQPVPVQEQQPVAWVEGRWYEDGTRAGNTLVWASRTAEDDFPVGTNLYTAQPRKAVKLTMHQITECHPVLYGLDDDTLAFARAIEQVVLKANGVCE